MSLGIFDTTGNLEAAISHVENKQCEGDGEMIGKHLSKEFKSTGETTKNIKLLLNSLYILSQISMELESAEHDLTIAVLIIFDA